MELDHILEKGLKDFDAKIWNNHSCHIKSTQNLEIFEVVWVVSIMLAFIECCFYSLKKLSYVFEEPGIFSEKLKGTLTSSNYHRNSYFSWNFAQVYYLIMSAKGFTEILLFYLDFFYMQKLNKIWFQHTLRNQGFSILINNSRSKQILKKSEQHFVDIGK